MIRTLLVTCISIGLVVLGGGCTEEHDQQPVPSVITSSLITGAEALAAGGFEPFHGKRVGLIVNHTARVGDRHVIDLINEAPDVELVALYGPEHGIRGEADAGAKVEDGVDQQTGIPVYSLYQGRDRRPSQESLEGIDILVFDIQDIGSRFYTYISTMGLAMQVAAQMDIPFAVLDRPNPLGGDYVSGFVLEKEYTSFVGQYPIPIAHGLTVGELAQLIKGEAYLDGLEDLDLTVIPMEGWERSMTWADLQLPWIPTSPNIPDFETAYVYPGTCFFEALEASEGRGTRTPFLQVGASQVDATELVQTIGGYNVPGVELDPVSFTPHSIDGMASTPRFEGEEMHGVKLHVSDWSAFDPVGMGIFLVHSFYHQVPDSEKESFFNERWLRALAGTERLHEALIADETPQNIIELWSEEVEAFRRTRAPYLLYD